MAKAMSRGFSRMFNWGESSRSKKFTYQFNEGSVEEVNLLGAKGANLCELYRGGIPVPHGFVISTEASKAFHYMAGDDLPSELIDGIHTAVHQLEKQTGKLFGNLPSTMVGGVKIPLLLSIRSDSPVPITGGMMKSVLNVGINEGVLQDMISASNNPKWAYDTYRRFLQMYGTIVLDIDPMRYEEILRQAREQKNVPLDSMLSDSELSWVVQEFKKITKVPEDPWEQIGMVVKAMFQFWWSDRSVKYRDLHNISQELGTGVIIQNMVYGNRNTMSGTGVAFTRNPSTGETGLEGEYLPSAVN